MGIESKPYNEFTQAERDREAACFRDLLDNVPPAEVGSVLELFGGVGLFGSQARERFPLSCHELWEASEPCAEVLRENLPLARVVVTDSMKREVPPDFSLVSADFNSFTALKWYRDRDYKDVMDRVFHSGAEWVQLTDSAVSKLHLNKRSYEKAMNLRVESAEDYVHALEGRVFHAYGYGLRYVTRHRNAAYLLFKKDATPKSVPLHRSA